MGNEEFAAWVLEQSLGPVKPVGDGRELMVTRALFGVARLQIYQRGEYSIADTW